MRVLALLFALISLPLLAADYTPWSDSQEGTAVGELLAQAPPYEDPSKPRKPQRHPGDYCCRHCRANEVTCGGECIPAMKNGKKNLCMKGGAGCACGNAPTP